MKKRIFLLLLLNIVCSVQLIHAQACYDLGTRNNGNGLGNTCGTPNCPAGTKEGHFDVNFGASCPTPIPTMQLISVTVPPMPTPFCFDPGSCISPGIVRYCFRGSNLPSSGFMTIRLTQGAVTWNCTYSVDGGSGTILPVRLSQFTAKLSQGKVQLHWRTEQELNNGWFVVERSADGRSFSPIASLPGNGTISTASDYYYSDQAPLKGISFYRLKQIDLDGQSDYSITRRIDNRQAGIQVSGVYPNPVQTEVNLGIMADRYFLINVVVYDATGKRCYIEKKTVRPGAQNLHIELPQLQAGIYELTLQGDNMSILSEKIIVM